MVKISIGKSVNKKIFSFTTECLVGLMHRYFGFAWSLWICNGRLLAYTMDSYNPMHIASHVMGRFKNGGDAIAPWSLHMYFNRKDEFFRLTQLHFLPDGTNVSEDFIREVSSIDPKWSKRMKTYPLLRAVGSKKALPIQRGDYEEVADRRRYLIEGEDPTEPSFETVCDTVFGTAKK